VVKSALCVRNNLKQKYNKYEMLWRKNKKSKHMYIFLNEENYVLTRDIVECVNKYNFLIRKCVKNTTLFDFLESIYNYEIRMYKNNKYKILQTNKLNFNLSKYFRIVDRLIYFDKNDYNEDELMIDMFLLLLSTFSNIYYYFDGISNNYNQVILYLPNLYKKKETFGNKKNILLKNYNNVRCQFSLLYSYTNLQNMGYLSPNIIFRYLVDNYVNFEYYSYIFSLMITKLNIMKIDVDRNKLSEFLTLTLENYYLTKDIEILLKIFLKEHLHEKN